MSALVSPRARGARTQVVVLGVLAAVATIAVTALWSAAPPAFADVHRLEIQSSSIVGARVGDTLAPAVRLDPPEPPAEVTAVVVPRCCPTPS